MTLPGQRLRAFAARFCSPRTMERLIDPVIADLQREHADAQRIGSVWEMHRALARGRIAYAKVMLLAGGLCAVRAIDAESGILRRLSLHVLGATSIAILLLISPYVRYVDTDARQALLLLLYLIPSATPLALSFGLLFGLIVGTAGSPVTRRLISIVTPLAVICALALFANLEFVVPDANQAFREVAFRAVGGQPIVGQPIPRGDQELTLAGLRRRIQRAPADGLSQDMIRHLEVSIHWRWANTAAPIAVTVLALSVARWIRRRRPGRILIALGACAAYYLAVLTTHHAGQIGAVPPFLSAWSVNVVCALAAALAWRTMRLRHA